MEQYKKELQETVDVWKKLIETVWKPERQVLAAFSVQQLLLLASACMPDGILSSKTDPNLAASIIELHFPEAGQQFTRNTQTLERALMNNFKKQDITPAVILEQTDFLFTNFANFLKPYEQSPAPRQPNRTLPKSVSAFINKLKSVMENKVTESKHFLLPVSSAQDSLTVVTMINFAYTYNPLPYNTVLTCSSNTTLIDLDWFLRRWRFVIYYFGF